MIFTSEQKKIIALCSLGGALEFYDFILFVFLAKLLGDLFFPATNPVASLLASLAVFAIGYIVRPLGGIIFGHFGDRLGRKSSFIFSAMLMAIPTFFMGLLPTYQSIGVTASVLLVILRMLQGLSVGGEIPGAIVFITETVKTDRRGIATALILFGVNMGMVVGSLVAALLMRNLTMEELMSWGWRLPFFLGGVLGLVSFYLRRRMHETPLFKGLMATKIYNQFPIKEIFLHHSPELLQGVAITALQAVIISLIFLFMPTYLATFFHFSLADLLPLNTLSILIFSFPILLSSHLSDRFGRKKIIAIGIIFFIVCTYPLFSLFQLHNYMLVVFVIALSGLFGSTVAGVFPCMTSELFSTNVRYTGTALVYNLGFGIIGGLTPLLVTSLIHLTNNNLAPGYYLSGIAMIALIALFFMRETYQMPLNNL